MTDTIEKTSTLLQFDPSPETLKEQLSGLAKQLISDISTADPEHSQELLSGFVSELFLAATQQSLRESRRKKQAEGIAKAKARGVRFGTPRRPLPDNFYTVLRSWQNREIPLREAAKQCNMPETTFYDAAKRAAQSAE
ncbi:hypothetical protein AALD01_19920 [Oscillospiraceae bacterium 21-37]